MTSFTNEEKEIVLKILNEKPGFIRTLITFSPYIIPSLAMFLYAFIKQDFLALVVSYSVLFGLVILYLVYMERSAKDLRSAIKKYEDVIKAL